MGRAIDLTGQRFGRLMVIERDGLIHGNYAAWKCVCDCGNTGRWNSQDLRSGNTTSCGCYRSERMSILAPEVNTVHGFTNSPEYSSWCSMKARCTNPSATGYDNYGGRGITVCEAWLHSFEAFYQDMGPRPSLDHTLEREEVNGNYEPGNCKWATWDEQALNRRNNVRVEVNGKMRVLTEVARETGIHYMTLRSRSEKGLKGEDLLRPPPLRVKRS